MPNRPLTPADRRVYLRRRIVAGAIALVVVGGVSATGIYSANAAAAPLPVAAASVTAPSIPDTADPAVAWPSYGSGAIGAVGFDGLLSSHGSDAPVPIASITKIVTALVVLDAKPLEGDEAGPTISFTSADVGYYNDQIAVNGSVAPVSDGLQLSERDALTTMLLPSANNYATSLAIWAFGSEEAYLAAATSWVQEHGLTGTTIADTSGLSPESTSTPSDLVALGTLAIADPVIASIVSMASAVIPGVGEVENTNALIGQAGIDGLKTGTTDEAGACLLYSLDTTVDGQQVTLVGVQLGGATHAQINADILAMLPSVESGFHTVTVSTAGTDVGTLSTEWGETVSVVADADQSVLVWGSEQISSTTTLDPISTVEDGAAVGSIVVTVGEKSFDIPLVADGAIDDPGFGWRFSHPDELFAPAA